MTSVNVYLTFNGNCREAFDFYKAAFGGEYSFIGTFGEMPPQPGMEISEAEKSRIMHVSLPVGGNTVLMGSDTTAESGDVVFGNNFSVSINTGSTGEADRFFSLLSNGGKIIMPMQNTFWGAYFGMFTDKFGVNWMINHDLNPEV